MKYHYLLQTPCFTAENIDVENVARPRDYRHAFRNGRMKHGFVYVVSGKIRADFGEKGGAMDIQADELAFMPKGSVYTGIYMEDNTEIRIVQFDLATGSLPDYLSQPVKIVLPRARELIDAFFEPINESGSPAHDLDFFAPKHPFYYLSCLYHFLWQVDASYARIPAKFRKLQTAFAEIDEHFDENRPIAHYAGLCAMSEVNFRRLFREYTGMSPIEYRNHLRLNFARRKLQSGEYNVSETAALCGFSNLSFFIRLYKKKFGHTPKQE